MLWIIRDNNYDATEYYIDILENAAILAGEKVKKVDNIELIKSGSKNDIYLVTTPIDAIKAIKMRKKRIFVWFQGVFSEESYMKHNSSIRRYMLRFIEKYILQKSEFIFFVSEEMKNYYISEFNINIDRKYHIMPCFNTSLNKCNFYKKDKYKKNIFCYAGSLSVWQGINTILKCYKKIEDLGIEETELLLLTNEKEKAIQLINKIGIKNYRVDYSTLENLPNILSEVKFGFVIREDNIVNRVSTPTKISTYMANGIIPIYSECLKDFYSNAKKLEYAISFDDKKFGSKLNKLMRNSLNEDEILNEFEELFKQYFNEDYHIKQISKKTLDIYKK